MSSWKKGQKAIRGDGPDGVPMKQIAESAVSAHMAQLYCIYEVRYGSGDTRIGWERSGRGTGAGEWVSHMVDLFTGEQFDVSSHLPGCEARRVQTLELPMQILEHWPVDDKGKLHPQGWNEKDSLGPAFFEELREKMKRPEDCEECGGSGVRVVNYAGMGELVAMGAMPETEEIPCPACLNLREMVESTRVDSEGTGSDG